MTIERAEDSRLDRSINARALSQILASDVSVGYDYPPCIVRSVNGYEVRNMRDLVRFIEGTAGDFVKLQLEVNGVGNIQAVIDRKKAEDIQEKVLKAHSIVRNRSPDLIF